MNPFVRRLLISTCVLAVAAPAMAVSSEDDKIDVNKTIRSLDVSPIAGTAATVFETEPNDDCSQPDPADLFVDDVAASIDVAGDEDWFVFEGMAGDCVTFATDSRELSTTDTQLYIYDTAGCTDPTAFLEFDDDGGPGLFSLISDFEIPADGTYYLRVKHFSSSGTGDYALSASSSVCPEPPANDTCDRAEPVACNSTVTGTTTLAANDIEDLDESCLDFGGNGPDVFYEVTVADGDRIDVMLTPTDWDPALWLVADCNDENSCLAGVDEGFFNDPETVSWVNDTGADQTIYIVPDGFNSGAFGDFELMITCDAAVDAEPASWGSVKSRF
ncbi:MAG TPA: PPC domain-containing protein [Candidatus Krumholzibacteria bacterium]|nr:PPC domain-containing protein [Candidatus Krumholzibacteria bacterium]